MKHQEDVLRWREGISVFSPFSLWGRGEGFDGCFNLG